MKLFIINHPFRYEIENTARLFFHSKITEICFEKNCEKDYILTEINDGNIIVEVNCFGKTERKCEKSLSDNAEWQMADMLYTCLCNLTGKKQEWGLLTGVRPTRLIHRMLDEGNTASQIRNKFINEYKVSEKRFMLSYKTAKIERNIIKANCANDFSLYISIPFCPSRCNYCSFVSQTVEKSQDLIPKYVDLLSKEIICAAETVKNAGLKLKSIYIGGGTPTTLTAEQLSFLMDTVNNNFDLSSVMEYTVEAGRPDTVTYDKLSAIFSHGADRISINPQTFNDNVLETIGRRHNCAQTFAAYELARKIGFKTINMDLIAGLSTDTLKSFENTLDTVFSLTPENITLHTLTVKRAAELAASADSTFGSGETLAEQMVSLSLDRFFEEKYLPYYLYRQKGTLSNLENVGYCKAGYEGYYNIYIMEEVHSIIALGAGAVTKLKSPSSEKIERVFNYKYPSEYIKDFENIIKRKQEVLKFYEKNAF